MRAAVLLVLAACGRIGFDVARDPRVIEIDAFETASVTFTPIPDATITVPASDGRWIVVASATLQSASFGEIAAELRYTIDGVERGMGGTQNSVADRPGPFQHFVVIDGATSEQLVQFELRDETGVGARVEQLRAYLIRAPESLVYEAADADRDVAAATFAPVVTFAPALAAGEYIFLALVNASEFPNSSDCTTRWIGANGTVVAKSMQNPRQPWQARMTIWRETVVASPMITLEAERGNATSSVRYVRLLAMPTADLTYDIAVAGPEVFTQTSLLVNELVPSIAGERFLRIQNVRLDESCDGMNIPSEREVLFEGGALSKIQHVHDNCAYQTTYGVFEVLDERPAKLTTTIKSGNGRRVNATDATIMLVAL